MRLIMDQFLWTLELDRVTRPAEEITTDAIGLLEKASGREQPFFLFVNYMDAHDPYLPRPPFDTIFPGKSRALKRDRYLAMARDVITRRRTMSVQELEHCLSQYDGAIRSMDHEIGRLIGRLKELKLYENTTIVITSDHGEAFGEGGFVNHRQSLHQDQVHIPLVIKYPGVDQTVTDNRLVSLVDVFPTILASAGVAIPEGLHGQSVLSPQGGFDHPIFAEAYVDLILARLRPSHPARQFAIFRDNMKLVSNSNGKHELYDLSQDPSEQQNLYSTNVQTAKNLQTDLNHWLDSIPMAVQAKTEMDVRTLERLKALGYIQ